MLQRRRFGRIYYIFKRCGSISNRGTNFDRLLNTLMHRFTFSAYFMLLPQRLKFVTNWEQARQSE